MTPDQEYFAFISYKREDEKWAKWLQHKLEHYKLPSNLNGRTDLPKEIRPIFKDTSELTPGNLPAQIHEALGLSKNLIVICSPRSAQSEWVNKEVETFIAMGKADNIIPFIIDGTAHAKDAEKECFPLVLRQLPEEQEILGANINEMGRDAAAVKVVAKMFDLKFDMLWQRYEKEQKKKRLIWWGISLLVATIAVLIAVVLKKQNMEIQEANWLMMENRARFVNVEIDKLIEDSDCYTACRIALYLLPQNLSHPDKPYLEGLEVSLRKALSENNAKIDTEGMGIATFSPDGTIIAECGFWQATVIWDANSGALLKKMGNYYYQDDWNSDRPLSVTFANDSKQVLTHYTQGSYSIWDIETGKEISHYPTTEQMPNNLLASFNQDFMAEDLGYMEAQKPKYTKDGHRYLYGVDGKIVIRNVQSGALKRTFHCHGAYNLKWANEGKVLMGLTENGVSLWDYSTGKHIGYVKDAKDIAYNSKNQIALFLEGREVLIKDFKNALISKFTLPNEIDLNLIRCYLDDTGDLVIVNTDILEALVYDSHTGNLLKRINIPTEGGFVSAVDSSKKRLATSGCGAGYCLFDLKADSIIYRHDGSCSDVIAISEDGHKSAVGTKEGGISLIIQRDKARCHVITLSSESEHANSIAFSHDGMLLVSTHDDGAVRVWNTETGTLMNSIKGHQSICVSAIFSPDDREIVSTDDYGVANVWEYLPLQELLNSARARFKNNPLTTEERRKYYLE